MERLIGSAILALGLAATPAHAKTTKLTFATYVPSNYSLTVCDGVFMDEVSKRTDGKVVFERFYAGTLLGAADLFPGLSRGAVQFAGGAPAGYNRADYPLSNVVLFMSEDAVAATQAFNDLITENEDLQQEYKKHNLRLLFGVVTAEHAVWAREPIENTADLKGKRIRTLHTVGDALSKMGATTVAMPFADAIDALSRGGVDAMANVPFDLGVSSGVNKVAPHVVDTGFGTFSAQVSAINLDVWNGLSPEVQKIMLEVAADVPTKCWAPVVNKDIETAVETVLAQDNFQVHVFSPEEKQRLKETVGAEVRAEWIQTAKAAGYENAEAFLNRYAELIAKYEPESGYKTGFQRIVEGKESAK